MEIDSLVIEAKGHSRTYKDGRFLRVVVLLNDD
jgi:hypothetical protein